MTKKQILLSIGISFLILASLSGVGFFLYNTNSSESVSNNQQSGGIAQANLESSGSTTIPLGEKTDNENSGGLTVDDSSRFSANLGSESSGSRNIGTSGSSAGSSTPSAGEFSQYAQYKDSQEVYFGEIVEGTGAEAQKDSQLAVTYKGYLTDGTMFDQSRTGANGQKEPLIFTLGSGQLIAGFEQGVAGMKAGGSRRIIIPPALGYGDKEQNGIPANSVLIFDVQLLTVQ